MQPEKTNQPIHESSGIEEKTERLLRPESGSLLMRSSATQWTSTAATGFAYKPLFEDTQRGLKTMLMKVEAGALAEIHSHDQLEQVYVLEGEFFDEYRDYGAGDFVVRAPGALHTGGSRSGALVLLVYSN